MATFTPNKGYPLPAVGSDLNVWGNELNQGITVSDLNLGGTAPIVLMTGIVVATTSQAQNYIQLLTGALTGNAIYTLPALGGFYFIINNTTGNFSVTINSSGGGAAIVIPQNSQAFVTCDGTNIFNTQSLSFQTLTAASSISVAGSANVQISVNQAKNYILNLNGALTGNITFTLTATPGTWFITNATTGAFTLTLAAPGGGATLRLPAAQSMVIVSDGTSVLPGMPLGWQTLATYTAIASPSLAIQLPIPFRRFRLTIDATVTDNGGFLQAQFSNNGGASWVSTATYNTVASLYFLSTQLVGTSLMAISNIITMPMTAADNYDGTMEIYPSAAGMNFRSNGIGGYSLQTTLAGENRVGNNPSVMSANAMRIFSTTGLFSGTFIIEGLP